MTEVTTLDDHGSTVRLDGGLGFGQVAGVAAIDLAIERARPTAWRPSSVRELTHLGALAYYTMRASAAGCFAMAFQNGAMIVPPFGGTTSLFSTNPFSYAVPAGAAPRRRLRHRHHRRGREQDPPGPQARRRDHPRGVGERRARVPTTDPHAASISHLQWFGGHKGFGIGLLVEIMAGVLADSSFGATEHSESELTGWDRVAKGASFVVLDVTRFLPLDDFRAHVDQLIDDVHARRSPRAPNGSSSRASSRPSGAPTARSTASRSPDALVEELDAMAASLDCPPPSTEEPGVDIRMSDRYGLTTITTELHDSGVLVATLNRPEHRNSLDPVMHLELKQLYEKIVDDEELNAVVLTGAGKYFCVGADFNSMEENVSYPDGHPGLLDRLGRAWRATSSRCGSR